MLQVYQRAVINPMMNIEACWKEYSSFEQSINPMIAEKLTQERSRDYMNARRVAKEYEAVTRYCTSGSVLLTSLSFLKFLYFSNLGG